MTPQFITFAMAAAVILSGCGGGGDNGRSTPAETPTTGPSVSAREVTSEAFADLQVSSGRYQSVLRESPRVTKFEGDDAGGFEITYMIDGTERPIRFTASDHGTDPENENTYYKELGDWIYTVEVETPRGSTVDHESEFNHFDIYFAEAFEKGETPPLLAGGGVGYFVHGAATQVLPTGTASYSGRFRAKLIGPDSQPPRTPSKGWLRSDDLTLSLDFTTSTVSGTIEDIEQRPRDQDSYIPLTGRFTIDGEMTNGPGLTAELAGTGDLAAWDVDMEGRVFGPQATEVGGVVMGTKSDGDMLIGYFGADTQ